LPHLRSALWGRKGCFLFCPEDLLDKNVNCTHNITRSTLDKNPETIKIAKAFCEVVLNLNKNILLKESCTYEYKYVHVLKQLLFLPPAVRIIVKLI
jgi:TPP-dependent 2-oxoacid decarboxylase